MLKCRKRRWAGYVARVGRSWIHIVFGGKARKNRSLWRPRLRWVGIIKMDGIVWIGFLIWLKIGTVDGFSRRTQLNEWVIISTLLINHHYPLSENFTITVDAVSLNKWENDVGTLKVRWNPQKHIRFNCNILSQASFVSSYFEFLFEWADQCVGAGYTTGRAPDITGTTPEPSWRYDSIPCLLRALGIEPKKAVGLVMASLYNTCIKTTWRRLMREIANKIWSKLFWLALKVLHSGISYHTPLSI